MSPKILLSALRPKQWTKNLVLFAGLIFSQNLGHPVMLAKTLASFALFCLLSGSVYIFNDLADIERDRLHPQKKLRPVASGALSAKTALLLGLGLGVFSLAASFYVNFLFGLSALAYFVLMLLYSFALKKLVIIDVFVIAAGFVLRAVAGAEAIAVPISEWLLICVILLALFLALAKRRQEQVHLTAEAPGHRTVLTEYPQKFLDQMISVVTAAAVVCYSLYTLSSETTAKFGNSNLKYTIPFVLYGIFRYLYLIYRKEEGQSPELALLTDPWLLGDLVLYVITVWLAIYL
ncbi:MAG: decaprenyl-phosphate phosphoribosyltransferase [bacterium]|nr:decaprenyl-phosphate phosphoribosyltransferase [bacterium]